MHHLRDKRQAAVCGETIEYALAGHGTPAVVLVNGAGGPIEAWFKVADPIARRYTTLAYNRPGLGRSSQPERPQTGAHLVASLHGLLHAVGIAPPFILVGHSLGGLIVNLYARLHPDEVAGVVMLEATSPDDPAALQRHEGRLQKGLKAVLDRLMPSSPHSEIRHVEDLIEAVRQAPAFPPVPLVVVTGTRPAMAWATPAEALAARARHQRELLALSPHSVHLLATRSGHFPQISEPQRLVQAIDIVAGRAQP